MAKVQCVLPNASEKINGVKFSRVGDAMVSEDVSDEIAASFASIPGYSVVADGGHRHADKSEDAGDATPKRRGK